MAGVATMARIHHRNVRRIFDHMLDKRNKRLLILSELCGAGSLWSLNAEFCLTLGRPSTNFIEDTFVQLVIAIQYIHRHLDGPMKRRPLIIDPKSVYFTDGGILKIDLVRILICSQEPEVRRFLLRSSYDSEDAAERSSDLTWYLAPETRTSRFFTEKSSIYSAGNIVRELIVPWGWKKSDPHLTDPSISSPLDTSSGFFRLSLELLELLNWSCCKTQRDRPSSEQLLDKMTRMGFVQRAEQRQGVVRLDDGSTLLMKAVREDDSTSARLHIGQAGLSNNDGLTALMIAAILNRAAVAKMLLKRESFFTAEKFVLRGWHFSDCTALMLGAAHGSIDVCRLLRPIEGGIQTSKGWTALMYAAGCKQIATTAMLLQTEAGLCTNQLSDFGRGFTALMSAAYNDSQDTCRLLASKEANMFTTLDNKKYPGWSALVFAAAVCSLRCTRILIEYEAEKFGILALQSVGKLNKKKALEEQKLLVYQKLLDHVTRQRDTNLTDSSSNSLQRLSKSTYVCAIGGRKGSVIKQCTKCSSPS
ncbi:Kinase, NEK [Giardia duodenalis]|uniref:Kinase, NEK n=1 Tax=Giardia intestinalis (strain ATCC 50803 / WB clone C6) TaxID=184922 RepID=A8BBS8_GIAIC|nr:Kinase, NEK [Giardia intestinalis]KAE8305245.1 Kinase, NEK [Giardia intestinalis]|eukprot:XP_001708055.1 Kinase, NEK-frag [Giardia lamblia ATCC 50803]